MMNRINKVKAFIIFMLLLVVLPLTPTVAKANEPYPKPTSYKYVNDYIKLLSEEDTNKLTAIGKELEDKTGAEATIVVIDTLYGTPIEEYANGLFREWGIGKKGENNGLLILIAKKDRKYRVEVGTGLEGVLPDFKCKNVMEVYAVPSFKKDDYAKGLIDSYSEFCDRIAWQKNITLDKSFQGTISNTKVASKSVLEKIIDVNKDIFEFFMDVLKWLWGLAKIIIVIVIIIFAIKSNKSNKSGGSGGYYDGGSSYSDYDSGSSYDSSDSGGSSDFGGGSSDGGGSSGDW